MIPNEQILVRLLISAALAAIVGFERERKHQVAGLRTHIILATASALAMMVSINVALIYSNQGSGSDPTRLAAQVLSGIGFLGAGAILRLGNNVKGLTTAASLWSVAIVGLATGAGLFIPAFEATVLLLVALSVINFVEDRLVRSYDSWLVTFQAADHPDLYNQFLQIVEPLVRKVNIRGFNRDVAGSLMTIEATIEIVESNKVEVLTTQLAALPGAREVHISAV